jgi:hypothetical protein
MLFILNQTGVLHGRHIGDHLRQVLETIKHDEKSRKSGQVLITNFEKAFDEMQLEFVREYLDYIISHGPTMGQSYA